MRRAFYMPMTDAVAQSLQSTVSKQSAETLTEPDQFVDRARLWFVEIQ